MEDSIRSDLCFDDAEGTTCLLNEVIFEDLACMGTMASDIICLADNQKFNFSKIRAGFSRVITPLFDTMMVQAPADMGDTPVETHQIHIVDQPSTFKPQKKQKPGRKQRKKAEVSNVESEDEDHIPTPSSDPLPSVMDATTGEHEEQIIKDVSTVEPVTTAGEVVTTTVKDSAAPTTNVTEDEITMAQALAALKSIKPKVVVQEQEMSTTILAAATTVTTDVPTPRAKGKAKMIELKIPIKKKDQMRIDEEYARKLEAEEQEAARLSRAQQDEEANNSWDNIQAMMDADKLLAERL
nr:hypothetical protein [Tanacetum cinerariifolium]